VAVASAGPYAFLHLAPEREPRQHPTTQFFTGRMPFLPPNQQRQSTVYTKKNTEKDNSQNLNKPLTWSLLRSSNWQEANNNPFNSPLSRTTWVNQYQQKTLIY